MPASARRKYVGNCVESAPVHRESPPEPSWNDRGRWLDYRVRPYFVDTVGRNKKVIKAYIANRLQEDQIADQMSLKEYIDQFTGSKNTKA